jgi:secreted trypsin-like serine protease
MKHCKLFTGLTLALALSACAPSKQNSEAQLSSGANTPDIVGGKVVSAQDAVAQSTVAIVIQSSMGEGLCSGTLIAPNIVLTAAHCTEDLTGAVIVFGTNLDSSKEARPADMVAVNPNYLPKAPGQGGWNDVALIRFKGTLPAGAKVAEYLQTSAPLKKGLNAVVAGFGTTAANGEGQDEGTLRKTTLTLQNPAYEKTELLFPLNSRGGSTCHGDSGGPAYITQNGKLTVIGITSRGTGAGCDNVSIFTSVAAQAAYIKTTIQGLQAAVEQK